MSAFALWDYGVTAFESTLRFERRLVVPVGLEPTTLALSTRCSNQLSYGTVTRKWFWACHRCGCSKNFDPGLPSRRLGTRVAIGPPAPSWDYGVTASALRFAPSVGWWSQTGSNRRPPECKSGALPTELWPHLVEILKNEAVKEPAKFILYDQSQPSFDMLV